VTLTFHLIPHTHWDREWYLPRAAFTARLVPAVDDLLGLLENDSAYRSFLLDGQTVLVEDYLAVRPDREAALRALAQSGRLQLGPWYVLADELIPSGESLLRNLLYGALDTARWGGRLEVLYSPDAFGHPAILPALAREFGIKAAALWRGLGGEPGQTRDVYRWRGPDGRDGRDLLLWHFPSDGYEVGAALPTDRERLRQAWAPLRAELTRRAATNHIAVPVGADHHAPYPDLPTLRERIAELEPQNAVRISRLDEFLKELAPEAAQAPELSGELRWSYRYAWTLQGVHSTRAPLKRRYSRAELQLERIVEPLAALARRAGGRDRRPLLDRAWRTLLRGTFHDTLCGCCADPVAHAQATRLDAVEATNRELANGAADDLSGHDPDLSRDHPHPDSALWLWNPVARTRSGVVIADTTWFRRDVLVGPPGDRKPRHGHAAGEFALMSADGEAIPIQVLSRRPALERRDAARHYPDQDEVDHIRIAFHAPAVDGLRSTVLRSRAAAPLKREVGAEVHGRMLSNAFVEVTVEPTGAVTLLDRRTNERFEGLLRLEEERDTGDLYTPFPQGRPFRAAGPIRVRRLAGGPLVASLEVGFDTPGATARLVLQLFDESPVLRCLLDIDNRAADHRLRLCCPLAVSGAALAGTAFGAVRRSPITVHAADYPRETPVTTAPAHRFVAAAQGNRGLALLAPGFFEYEWTPTGDLLFTILRGAGELSRDDLPTRPGHAGWPTSTPDGQCLGKDRVELALVAVGSRDLDAGEVLPELWEDVFLPTRARWLRNANLGGAKAFGATLDGRGLVLSAVKPAQTGSGLVLRCYNAREERVVGAWRLPDAIKTAHRVRADEKAAEPLVVEGRGHTVRFIAEAHEIVTLLIT